MQISFHSSFVVAKHVPLRGGVELEVTSLHISDISKYEWYESFKKKVKSAIKLILRDHNCIYIFAIE